MKIGVKTPSQFAPWLAYLREPKRLLAVVLVLITLALYSPVVDNDFINYDDPDYVTANQVVKRGLTVAGVRWAFRSTVLGNWHPLTWLSHMLDCTLFGVSPTGPHIVNVLWHSTNVVLLFFLLSRMTGTFWRSALVAALFAWHPLHVESVAWISERKDVLSTCFGLLALLYYHRYVTEGRRFFYWLSLGMFAVSLLSKPMLVTLPFVMLLLDYWPLTRLSWAPLSPSQLAPEPSPTLPGIEKLSLRLAIVEKIPFFALTLACSAVAVWTQGEGKAIATTEAISLQERIVNVLISYAGYLQQTLWPVKLIVPYLFDPTQSLAAMWFPLGILVVITAVTLRLASRRYLFAGWCIYLGTLVPVIGFLHVGEQAHADRYTYLPLMGVFVMLVWGSADAIARFRRPQALAAGGWGLVLLACCCLTWRQTQFWKNSETLFSHTLTVEPRNRIAIQRLGIINLEAGHTERALFYFQEYNRVAPPVEKTTLFIAEALNLLNRPHDGIKLIETYAARSNVMTAEMRITLGQLAEGAGDRVRAYAEYQQAQTSAKDTRLTATLRLAALDAGNRAWTEAEAGYRRVLAEEPDNVIATLGMALVNCDQGRIEEARKLLERAMAVAPFSYGDYYRLATVQAKLEMNAQAERNYLRSIEKYRLNYDAYYNLGNLYARHGAFTNAVQFLGSAVQLKPYAAEARNNLGVALASVGLLSEAAGQYREALKLAPTTPDAYYGLARVLELQANFSGAATNYARAIRFKPDLHAARLGLATVLIRQGKWGEAIPQLEVFLKANPTSGLGHLQMGIALRQLNLAADALPHLKQAVELRPRDRSAIDTLARLLATAPDASLRNGARAVELSEAICQPREQAPPALLDTLAAAQAEAGSFDQARVTAGLALEAARLAKDTTLAASIEKHLALYQAGQPLREAY